MGEMKELERQIIEEAQLIGYTYEHDYDRVCPECGGSGIASRYDYEPQGDGTYFEVLQTCVCPICS